MVIINIRLQVQDNSRSKGCRILLITKDKERFSRKFINSLRNRL